MKPKYIEQLRVQFGLAISENEILFLKDGEKWGPNGDGFYWAEVKTKPNFDFIKFYNQKQFKELPIKEDIPVGEKYNYLASLKSGKYLMEVSETDPQDFKIVVYDKQRSVLFFLYQYY